MSQQFLDGFLGYSSSPSLKDRVVEVTEGLFSKIIYRSGTNKQIADGLKGKMNSHYFRENRADIGSMIKQLENTRDGGLGALNPLSHIRVLRAKSALEGYNSILGSLKYRNV